MHIETHPIVNNSFWYGLYTRELNTYVCITDLYLAVIDNSDDIISIINKMSETLKCV